MGPHQATRVRGHPVQLGGILQVYHDLKEEGKRWFERKVCRKGDTTPVTPSVHAPVLCQVLPTYGAPTTMLEGRLPAATSTEAVALSMQHSDSFL